MDPPFGESGKPIPIADEQVDREKEIDEDIDHMDPARNRMVAADSERRYGRDGNCQRHGRRRK